MNITPSRDPSSRLASLVSRAGVFCAVLLAACAALLPSLARAQLYTDTQNVTGSGNQEAFGMYVAASGDTLVVSAVANNRAYIFKRTASGWVLQQSFLDGTINPSSDVAVDGDTLLARGTIYTRINGTWQAQQTFQWEHPRAAIDGDTLVVGNPYNRVSDRGNVSVYVRSGGTWTMQASFGPAGSAMNLGDSVDINGDTLIASANGPLGAVVRVRVNGEWFEQARLAPPSGNTGGMHVAVEGDIAAVSEPQNNRVHLFTRSGTSWTLTNTLTMPATGGSNFGYDLAFDGGRLAIGADTMYYVYVNTSTGWLLAQSISRPGYRFEGNLALANDGKLLAIGNPSQNNSNGIVDIFSVPAPAAPGNGWKDVDVGTVGVAGNSSDNGTQVMVRGSGADIWDRADGFHYRTETMTGDGAIIARVDSAGSGHPWSKVGIMFREDVAPASRNVMALVAAGSPVGMQVRAGTFENTSFTDAPWLGAPLWLMLAREGNLFAAYRSSDGDNWTPIGSATVTMPQTIHVGLAVSSHDNSTTNTGTFSGIELVGGTEPPPPPNAPSNLTGSLSSGTTVQLTWTDNSGDETGFSVERSAGAGSGAYMVIGSPGANVTTFTDPGLAANTTYTYRVKAVRDSSSSAYANPFTITTTNPPPATLTGTDIGTATPGGFSESGGVLTVDAAGADIWNQADEGYFVNRELVGNFDLRAKVSSLDANVHPWAKAGVMVRESLDPRSRNLFTMISAGAAAGLQVRDPYGFSTTFTEGRWVTAPYWVRLTRIGDTFQSFISGDGSNWQLVATRTIALATTLRAGVAVSSHHHTFRVRATFENLSFGN